MATMNEMREAIIKAYPNATMKWHEHIATTKNTRQIVAIYRKITAKKEKTEPEYHQIDMFEYMLTKQDKGSHTEVAI